MAERATLSDLIDCVKEYAPLELPKGVYQVLRGDFKNYFWPRHAWRRQRMSGAENEGGGI